VAGGPLPGDQAGDRRKPTPGTRTQPSGTQASIAFLMSSACSVTSSRSTWERTRARGASSCEGDELRGGYFVPTCVGGAGEFVGHRQGGFAAASTTGDPGPEAYAREGGLDRVGSPEVDGVLGREVVEGEQGVELVHDLGRGLREAREGSGEGRSRRQRLGAGGGVVDSLYG
jgi:hypothetical protein